MCLQCAQAPKFENFYRFQAREQRRSGEARWMCGGVAHVAEVAMWGQLSSSDGVLYVLLALTALLAASLPGAIWLLLAPRITGHQHSHPLHRARLLHMQSNQFARYIAHNS